MVAYTRPQQRKKEECESKRLRGEIDQLKFIALRFEGWQKVRFRKAGRKQDVSQARGESSFAQTITIFSHCVYDCSHSLDEIIIYQLKR